MIQRIQTVFLFLAAMGFISLFKFPFAKSNMSESPLFEDKMFLVNDNIIMMILSVLGALACLVSISQYKNRLRQMRMAYIAIIMSIFLGVTAVWFVYSEASNWSEQLNITDGAGIYISGMVLLFIILANYFIKKDEKTVRSMDRLR